MSTDPNRPRPRSSKKRRAVAGGGGRQTGGRVRGGNSTPPAGGIPGLWLAIGAVGVFVVGVLLASGTIGGGGAGGGGTPSPSSQVKGSLTVVSPSGSPVARGTNCPTSQPAAAPAGETRVVKIQTAKGSFEITLMSDLSPIAVGNFAALAGCGYYDGVVFHRIATLQDGTPFVIQGGDPTGTGTGGPGYTIQDEPVRTPYIRGTVAMARTSAPNSVGSQFFVVLDDKDQSVLASANTYQIIGSVTKGMDVVDAIYAAAGGVELPTDPIAMDKVTIGPPGPAASGSAPVPAASPSNPTASPS